MLEDLGYETILAKNGAQAIRKSLSRKTRYGDY